MDVFTVPIRINFALRQTAAASINESGCHINLPKTLIAKKNQLTRVVDQVYWRLLAKSQTLMLQLRANELNQLYFQFKINKIRYHRQFRRWGSCSSLRNINLSHRLIGSPSFLADYVIIHELIHLKHLNHGREFRQLMKMVVPEAASLREELMVYGHNWQLKYNHWLCALQRETEKVRRITK